MAIRIVTLKVDDEKVDFEDFMADLNEYLEDDVADNTVTLEQHCNT